MPVKKTAAEECCAKCEKDVAGLKKEVAALKKELAKISAGADPRVDKLVELLKTIDPLWNGASLDRSSKLKANQVLKSI